MIDNKLDKNNYKSKTKKRKEKKKKKKYGRSEQTKKEEERIGEEKWIGWDSEKSTWTWSERE